MYLLYLIWHIKLSHYSLGLLKIISFQSSAGRRGSWRRMWFRAQNVLQFSTPWVPVGPLGHKMRNSFPKFRAVSHRCFAFYEFRVSLSRFRDTPELSSAFIKNHSADYFAATLSNICSYNI